MNVEQNCHIRLDFSQVKNKTQVSANLNEYLLIRSSTAMNLPTLNTRRGFEALDNVLLHMCDR